MGGSVFRSLLGSFIAEDVQLVRDLLELRAREIPEVARGGGERAE